MLTSYLPIGHGPSDNERERKLKSIFALVMIGCALPGRRGGIDPAAGQPNDKSRATG